MSNTNTVVITGNLTGEPELKSLPSGTSICKLRLASSTRQRNSDGDYEDRPNYFDIVVWGGQGETAAKYLTKGRKIGVTGRLSWREWDEKDTDGNATGRKRQAVEIVADQVEFLDPKRTDDTPSPAAAVPELAAVGANNGAEIPF